MYDTQLTLIACYIIDVCILLPPAKIVGRNKLLADLTTYDRQGPTACHPSNTASNSASRVVDLGGISSSIGGGIHIGMHLYQLYIWSRHTV